ncbi:hypothetical protein Pelo_10611 [Pelomyxa schiedti]|nr:hypothetical protein Pelo_10611 [Pelomyxa schiedti]
MHDLWDTRLLGWIGPDRAVIRRAGHDDAPPTMRVVDEEAREIGAPMPLPFRDGVPLVACNRKWMVMAPKQGDFCGDLVVWAIVDSVPSLRYVVLPISPDANPIDIISLRIMSPSGVYNETSDIIEVFFTVHGNGLDLLGHQINLQTAWTTQINLYTRVEYTVKCNLSILTENLLCAPLYERVTREYHLPFLTRSESCNLLNLSTQKDFTLLGDIRGLRVQRVDESNLGVTTETNYRFQSTSVFSLRSLTHPTTATSFTTPTTTAIQQEGPPESKRRRTQQQLQLQPAISLWHTPGTVSVVAGCGLLASSVMVYGVMSMVFTDHQFSSFASAHYSSRRPGVVADASCYAAKLPLWIVAECIGKMWVMATERVVLVEFASPLWGRDYAPPIMFRVSFTVGLLTRPCVIWWDARVLGWTAPGRAVVRGRARDASMRVVNAKGREVAGPIPLPFADEEPLVVCNRKWVVMAPHGQGYLSVWAVVDSLPEAEGVVLDLSDSGPITVISLRMLSSDVYDENSDTLEVILTVHDNGLALCGYHVQLDTAWKTHGSRACMKCCFDCQISGLTADVVIPLFDRAESTYHLPYLNAFHDKQFTAFAAASLPRLGVGGCFAAMLPQTVVTECIGKRWVMAVERVVIAKFSIAGTTRNPDVEGGADPGCDLRTPPVLFSLSFTVGLVRMPGSIGWSLRVLGFIGPDRVLRMNCRLGNEVCVIVPHSVLIKRIALPSYEQYPMVACNRNWIVMAQRDQSNLVVWKVECGVPSSLHHLLPLSTESKVDVFSLKLISPSGVYNERSDTLQVFFTKQLLFCGCQLDLNTVWNSSPLRPSSISSCNLAKLNLTRHALCAPLFDRAEANYHFPFFTVRKSCNLLDMATGSTITWLQNITGLRVQAVDESHISATSAAINHKPSSTSVFSLQSLIHPTTTERQQRGAPEPKRRRTQPYHEPNRQRQRQRPLVVPVMTIQHSSDTASVVAGCGLLIAISFQHHFYGTQTAMKPFRSGTTCTTSTHSFVDAVSGATLFHMAHPNLVVFPDSVAQFPFVLPMMIDDGVAHRRY